MESYYLYLVLGALLAVFVVFGLVSHPAWIVYAYVILVPLLPPVNVGEIQFSALDFLSVPACLYLFTSGKRFLFSEKISSVFAIYVLLALLSVLNFYYYSQEFTLDVILRWFRLVEMLIPVLLAYQLRDKLSFTKIVNLFLLSGMLTAFTAFAMFLSNSNLCESQTFAGGTVFRAAGTHCDTSSFGNLMGTLIILSVWVFVYWDKIKTMGFQSYSLLLSLGALLACSMALMLSSSRGGFLQVIFGIGCLCFISMKYKKIKGTHLWMVGLICFVGFSFLLYINYLKSQNELVEIAVQSFAERLVNLGELGSSLDDGTSGRVENWESAISQYVNTPLAWVFGLGYKILIEVHDITPDNNFLQAFVEMGFLGLFSLVALLFFVFEACVRLLRRESEKGALLFSVWFGIAFSMLAVDVTTFWHNLPIYLILLMICCRNKAYRVWVVQPSHMAEGAQSLNRNDRI